jgi:threonine dehydrogenase-like Zn-dependent dehydrogenase
MSLKARAMVQIAARRLEMQEIDVPRVASDEGLLRVEACGLCGSDVEQYRGHFVDKGIVSYPVVPGHEPIGVIVEIGAEAAQNWGVSKGDRVALEPHLSCGFCQLCLCGNYHRCKSIRPTGLPAYGYLPRDFGHGLWGGYAEYIHLHPRTIMHRIPNGMQLEMAAMYQALAAGVRWAAQVPRTSLGDTVLILGCGQRGLGSVIAAREAGASRIIVTGLARDAHKLRLAESLGATHTIVADLEDVVERVQAITHGEGADIVLDVVPASPHPVVHAVETARIGGTIVLAGVKGKDTKVSLDTDRILFKELTLTGVYSQGTPAYREALRILSENRYDLGRLHTHSFPLHCAAEAIETLAGERSEDQAVCVSLHPSSGSNP